MRKFRLDRALSVGLVYPALRMLDGHRRRRVPILMYHGIREGRGRKHPYFETNTSPGLFCRHMQFFRDKGYTTVDLRGALEAITSGSDVGRRVAITFDDGYRDFYAHAFPTLAEHGFKATVFIVSGLTGEQRICKDNKEFMTWSEIREVHSYGIQVGSHTVNHPELYRLSPRELEDEIKNSKETIEDWLGAGVSSFSYPFAFPEHDKEFVKMVQFFLERHGYENGVSTIIGTAGSKDDRFFLPRLPVNSWDDLDFFRAKLEGGYDWLHLFQRANKLMKAGTASWIRESNQVTSLSPR